MNIADNLAIEMDGNQVLLRAYNPLVPFGLMGFAMSGYLLVYLIREEGLLLAMGTLIFPILISLYMLLPRTITTRFDLQGRRIRRLDRYCFCYDWRDLELSWDRIAGIGRAQGRADWGPVYRPELVLACGTTIPLTPMAGSAESCRQVIGRLCDATGLKAIDD